MRLFKSDWVERILLALRVPDDQPIENKSVTKSIASAQGQVEGLNFESRKNVLKYDDVMSRQREVIYGERRQVLEGADLEDQVRTMIDEFVTGYVTAATEDFPEEWDLEALWTAMKTVYPVGIRYQDLEREAGGRDGLDRETLIDDLKADAHKAYDAREAEVGAEVLRELERQVLLSVLDRKWREHLYEMDYLREGIGLRAYSQRDPLVEYQREGFDMFNAMKEGIREETVGFLFNLEVQVEDDEDQEQDLDAEAAALIEGMRAAEQPPTSRTTRPRPRPPRPRHAPLIRAKGLDAPKRAAEPHLLRAQRGRRGRGQGLPGPRPRTRTPGPAATRCAPAARARSTRSATAPRVVPPTSRPGPPAEPGCGSAELQGGAAPAPLDHVEARGDRARAVPVAHVDADLGRPRRGAEQVHAAHLAAQPSHAPVAGGRALEQRGPALQVGVDLVAGPAQQLLRTAVAAHHLDDGAGEALDEGLELGPVARHEA